MVDLIDREVLTIKLLEEKEYWMSRGHGDGGINMILAQIGNVSSVDAVPVVRCGECRNSFKSCPCDTIKLFCGHNDISTQEEDTLFERSETDFCSHGERREQI